MSFFRLKRQIVSSHITATVKDGILLLDIAFPCIKLS